jgi:hypothetical protein
MGKAAVLQIIIVCSMPGGEKKKALEDNIWLVIS